MTAPTDTKAKTHLRIAALIATLAFILAALVAVPPAFAHPGPHYAFSLQSGFLHPVTGLDHMLAMVAVGLWAGLNGGRAVWIWPLAFVAAMLAGGAAGMAQLTVPYVEPGILTSLVLLGLVVAMGLRAPTAVGAVLVGLFAVLHGHAHGAELPAGASALGYAAGFATATLLLHAMGIAIVRTAGQGTGALAVRSAGALVALSGLVLFVR